MVFSSQTRVFPGAVCRLTADALRGAACSPLPREYQSLKTPGLAGGHPVCAEAQVGTARTAANPNRVADPFEDGYKLEPDGELGPCGPRIYRGAFPGGSPLPPILSWTPSPPDSRAYPCFYWVGSSAPQGG